MTDGFAAHAKELLRMQLPVFKNTSEWPLDEKPVDAAIGTACSMRGYTTHIKLKTAVLLMRDEFKSLLSWL